MSRKFINVVFTRINSKTNQVSIIAGRSFNKTSPSSTLGGHYESSV